MTEIVPATDAVAIGPGWGRLETFRGESFRWVNNDALFYVAALKRTEHSVMLQIEPGPGVGLKPFTLKVFGEDGKQVAELDVKGRQMLSFLLQVPAPKIFTLRLHTDDGGKSAPNDPRVLNFRVFRIETKRMPADVVMSGSGFRLGSGWYPLESFGGESFRWVNNDAVIEAGPDAPRKLELELESGPGLEQKPFTLKIHDQSGAVIQSFDVKSREPITIELPDSLRFPTSIRLHVEGGGKSATQDSRIMNFRVFEATSFPATAASSTAGTGVTAAATSSAAATATV